MFLAENDVNDNDDVNDNIRTDPSVKRELVVCLLLVPQPILVRRNAQYAPILVIDKINTVDVEEI